MQMIVSSGNWIQRQKATFRNIIGYMSVVKMDKISRGI